METTHGNIEFQTRPATGTGGADRGDVEDGCDGDKADADSYSDMDNEYDDW